jgi:hypothetical protein
MSRGPDLKRIEQALEQAGVAWQLALGGLERQGQLLMIHRELGRFLRHYRTRFPEDQAPNPVALAEENPTKAAAFFHPETLLLSEEMRVMAWRLLEGDEIEVVRFQYRAGKPHELTVVLRSLSGKQVAFAGLFWHDVFALRHFGIGVHNELLALRGYYANTIAP